MTSKWAKGTGGPAGDEVQNIVFEPRFARNGRGAPTDVVPPLKAESGQTGKGDGAPVVFDPTQVTHPENRSNPQEGDPCHTLPRDGAPPVAFNVWPTGGQGADLEASPTTMANALSPTGEGKTTDRGTRIVDSTPRRLTPRECERLQGFPDDWTLVDYLGKPMADGPRYRMMGNAVTVNVAQWLGERIMQMERKDGR